MLTLVILLEIWKIFIFMESFKPCPNLISSDDKFLCVLSPVSVKSISLSLSKLSLCSVFYKLNCRIFHMYLCLSFFQVWSIWRSRAEWSFFNFVWVKKCLKIFLKFLIWKLEYLPSKHEPKVCVGMHTSLILKLPHPYTDYLDMPTHWCLRNLFCATIFQYLPDLIPIRNTKSVQCN